MAYTVSEIAELVEYHLVVSACDDDAAQSNLLDLVHQIEATPGLVSDWSLPGAHPEAAAYEMARTTCRRAERNVVRFIETGAQVDPNVLAYLNRLSDLTWLFGRLLEVEAGVNSRLRDAEHPGGRWSRAW